MRRDKVPMLNLNYCNVNNIQALTLKLSVFSEKVLGKFGWSIVSHNHLVLNKKLRRVLPTDLETFGLNMSSSSVVIRFCLLHL